MVNSQYLKGKQVLFGKRSKELRIIAGYKTQRSFAKAYTGETKKTSFISKIDHGANIEFKTIVRLAITLKMPLLNLFDFKGKFPVIIKEIYNIDFDIRLKKELSSLGKMIKILRKEADLTLLEADVLSTIADTNWSQYEQGKENLEFNTIVIIAHTLKKEIWELFDYKRQYSGRNRSSFSPG